MKSDMSVHGLNLNYSQQAYVFKCFVPRWLWSFQMWGLGGVNCSLGMVFELYLPLVPVLLFEFWSAKKQEAYPCKDLPPHLPCCDEPVSKTESNKAVFPPVVFLGYSVIVMRKYKMPKKVIVKSKEVQEQSCGTLQGQESFWLIDYYGQHECFSQARSIVCIQCLLVSHIKWQEN